MYIKQILFVIEGLVQVMGGEWVRLIGLMEGGSVSGREHYWWTTFNINAPLPGKVGQNPQSQTTLTGLYLVLMSWT